MTFVLKTVNPSNHIGPDIVELRERLGWSRAQASCYSKLTESLLTALETEAWEDVGDAVYTERLLRSYVKLLGGNENYFVQKYRQCVGQKMQRPKADALPRPCRVRGKDLAVSSRVLTLAGFLLFVVVLGGYVFSQARAISAAPPITVDSPSEGARLDQPSVEVRGKTLPESSVSINGQQAVVQPDGVFQLTLDVPRGTTMIQISARKRHGQEAVETRHVVYDRPMPELFQASSTAVSIGPQPITR